MTLRSRRSRLGLVSLAAVVLALTACDSMPRPAGVAPLRYRDAVFADVTVTRDLRYGTAPDNDGEPVALELDLYEPTGDRVSRRPVVIWAHGGGFSMGDKDNEISVTEANHFARRGYVAVSLGYRLLAPAGCTGNSGGTGPSEECTNAAVAAIHDGQAAVRWLRANAARYRIDPHRIAIGGESAGAILATGVGMLSEAPGGGGNPSQPSYVNGWISISGGVPGGIFADGRDAPGLLFAGTEDRVVPYSWSAETADALRRKGVLAVFKTLEGAGHVPWGQYRNLFLEQSVNFLYHVMDLRQAGQ